MRCAFLKYILLSCYLGTGLFQRVWAQISPNTPASASMQIYAQSWSFNDDGAVASAKQNVIPLSVYLPVADRIETRLLTSYAQFSTQNRLGEEASVKGFTDLKVQTGAALLENRNLVLGLALNIPSGNNDLNQNQQDILQAFTSPDLSIRENRLGVGLNVGTTISYAQSINNPKNLIGAALGFVQNGPYKVFVADQQLKLNPGSEATLALAFSHQEREQSLFISPSLTIYGKEKWDDTDALKIGHKIQLQGIYSLPVKDNLQLSLGLNQLFRLAPTRYSNGTAVKDSNGTLPESTVIIGATYRFPTQTTLQLNQVGRLIQNPNPNLWSSRVFESNFAVQHPLNKWLNIGLGQRFILGKSHTAVSNRTLRGNEGFFKVYVQF